MDENFIEKLTSKRKKAVEEYLQNNSYELLKKIERSEERSCRERV